MTRSLLVVALLIVLAVVAFVTRGTPRSEGPTMNALAERYVRLVLALGQHDADYVDAYYGPAEWRKEAEAVKVPLSDIDAASADLVEDLAAIAPTIERAGGHAEEEELLRLRHHYLTRQLAALRARLSMLLGQKLKFDEESKALYDAVAPTHRPEEFQRILAEIDGLLPGDGTLLQRYEAFRSRYVIPRDRLEATFNAAIEGCRSRTLQHITLPGSENFTVEYVTNKSWGAYNWYKGDYRSVIQVNTDLPIHADRAIDLACHEGYPGHHVYNTLLEKNLVRDRGWPEFAVYALFSPQSLIAEGTANYGIEVAFPQEQRIDFERRVIFPAAGLDPAGADLFYKVLALVNRLSYASNEAARQYIDGQLDAAAAAAWLEKFALHSPQRAQQQVRFIDQYRSYVINYNLGKDMVARSIESQGGNASNPDRRWELFEQLLSSPRLPSTLETAQPKSN